MTAYIVLTRISTKDQAEMDIYTQTAPAALPGSKMTALVLYGEQEILEGPDHEGLVVVSFPTVEAAKAWYNDPAYREAREHRFLGAEFHATLVEGLPDDQIAMVRQASGAAD